MTTSPFGEKTLGEVKLWLLEGDPKKNGKTLARLPTTAYH